MRLRSFLRPLALASSLAALLGGLQHCSTSHPPIAEGSGYGAGGGGGTGQCYQAQVSGGCSLPFYFPGLPFDVPIKQSDLPADPDAGGGMTCAEVQVGLGICAMSQQRTFTCVEPGVFTVSNTPGCKWPDGGVVGEGGLRDEADASTTDAGATDAAAD